MLGPVGPPGPPEPSPLGAFRPLPLRPGPLRFGVAVLCAALRAPTSSFPCNRLGGAICVAPTGLDFDVRPSGVICAAPADLPLGVSLSGCYNAALAGIAPTLRRSSQLGLLGPSSHRLLELRGLRHYIHYGQGLRRRVRRCACPGLEGLGRRKLGRIPGDGLGSRGRNAEVSRTGGSIK